MEMKAIVRLAALILVLGSVSCDPSGTVLYAQSLPTTLHLAWGLNPPEQFVTNYIVVLDDGAPQNVSPATCSQTGCEVPLVVTAYGRHTVSVSAQNLEVSASDGFAVVQTSAPVTLTFTVSAPPTTVKNMKV